LSRQYTVLQIGVLGIFDGKGRKEFKMIDLLQQ